MKIHRIGNSRVAISSASDMLDKHYKAVTPDLKKYTQVGSREICKAASGKPISRKIIAAPYSMLSLLNLLDTDEYHFGCVDAKAMATVMQVECKNPNVTKWFEAAEYPGCEDESTILSELVKFQAACGNGFLIKMRDSGKKWVGLERLLPNEVSIMESYDEQGFFRPNYVQTKDNKKTDFAYADIIHLKTSTHKSNAWGLASLPIAINAEILAEIKTFDYNNFKNGLMADYFMIVEGGTLKDSVVLDENGEEVITDAYAEIEKALIEAKGNSKSHSTVLIESESKDVKIHLEPLRQQDKDGGFLALKKDLREGIFAYHRVPPRLVSQLVAGQLGGDNNSDMELFYNFVVKPLQNRLALALANEFNYEFQWGVKASDFNFGNLTETLMSADQKLFANQRGV